MGIKFRCPNGHKLNVKSFLAGKRGICPHCGVKVQIPADAEREEEEGLSQGGVATSTAKAVVASASKSLAETAAFSSIVNQPAAASAAPTTTVNPTIPTGTPVTTPAGQIPMGQVPVGQTPVGQIPMGHAPSGQLPTVATPVTGALPMPGGPSPYAMMPNMPHDPIAEAPQAVWYVRPPSGGQFGPARGDIMRKWMGEGRVSADSLVWRDGWADWKPAASVFPALGPAPGALAAAPTMTTVPLTGGASSIATGSPAGRAVRIRKRSNGFAVTMVVVLGLIAILLLGLFIAVLNGLGSG
jgi:hypothetical protein